jgi:hypothetical protein
LLGWYWHRKVQGKFNDAARNIEQVAAQVIAAGEGTRDGGGQSGTRQTGEVFDRRIAS